MISHETMRPQNRSTHLLPPRSVHRRLPLPTELWTQHFPRAPLQLCSNIAPFSSWICSAEVVSNLAHLGNLRKCWSPLRTVRICLEPLSFSFKNISNMCRWLNGTSLKQFTRRNENITMVNVYAPTCDSIEDLLTARVQRFPRRNKLQRSQTRGVH